MRSSVPGLRSRSMRWAIGTRTSRRPATRKSATCSKGPPHRTRATPDRGAGAPGAPEVDSARGPVGQVVLAGTEREQFDGAVQEQVAGLAMPAGAEILPDHFGVLVCQEVPHGL